MKLVLVIVLSLMSVTVFGVTARNCDVVEYEKKGKTVYVVVPEGRSVKLIAMIRSFDTYLEAKIGHLVGVQRGFCKSIFDPDEDFVYDNEIFADPEDYPEWADEVFDDSQD